MRPIFSCMLLAVALLTPDFSRVFGQSVATGAQPETNQTVRIGVTLVQVDAVVTDSRGNRVTDLKPGDFEVLMDGRPQQITNFSYISGASSPFATSPQPKPAKGQIAVPVPAAQLSRENVQRAVALVVDDLSMSMASIYRVKRALAAFVDEQMQPGDLVAIIRGSAAAGPLQQFTSDKRVLHSAIDRLQFHAFEFQLADDAAPVESRRTYNYRHAAASGTMAILEQTVRGMSEMPGRKSVVLFTDGFPVPDLREPPPITEPLPGRPLAMKRMQRVIDSADRSGVVIYSVYAKGLVYTGVTASDDLGQSVQQNIARYEAITNIRAIGDFVAKHSADQLPEQTGGFPSYGNDLEKGMQRVLDDQTGYYLIGFVPDESVFRSVGGFRSFHKLKIKVKRNSLIVRYRKGFYGITDEEERKATEYNPARAFRHALLSPFASLDIGVKLTAIFSNSSQSGSFVRSLFYIDPQNLTFEKEEPGWVQATFDIALVAVGDNGIPIARVRQNETARVRETQFQQALKNGILYSEDIPINYPGGYQMRVAVRDSISHKLGSASQFVEVPDIGHGDLALSGLIVNAQSNEQANHTNANSPEALKMAENTTPPVSQSSLLRGPATRSFHPGDNLDVAFIVFNLESSANSNIQARLRIVKDGVVLSEGDPQKLDIDQGGDHSRWAVRGAMALPKDLNPGSYVLQVICSDELSPKKTRVVTQWVDFDVIEP